MTRFSPTPEQLHGALEDIAYEIEQVIGICWRLIQLRAATQEAITESREAILEESVYLECFLLHFRLLRDFFERSTRMKKNGRELDDVISADYGFAARAIAVKAELKDRINQEITHLSYSRTQRRGSAKDWFPADMALPLLACCDAFAEHLLSSAESGITPDVRADFALIRDMIRNVSAGRDA